jgi:hypothetical protein
LSIRTKIHGESCISRKKTAVRRALICPYVNSTQKLLTLDFPTLPSLIDWQWLGRKILGKRVKYAEVKTPRSIYQNLKQ